MLPLTGSYVESLLRLPDRFGTSDTSIEIHASPEKVWDEIASVEYEPKKFF